jgi:prevent-host-death family protein
METIAISKFKATCLAVLEEVNRTGKPVLVTRFGKPVAEVTRPRTPDKPRKRFGRLKGTMEIMGDIVSPGIDLDEWEMLRD